MPIFQGYIKVVIFITLSRFVYKKIATSVADVAIFTAVWIKE